MDMSNQFKLNDIPEPQRSTILAALTEIVLSKLALQSYDRLSPEDQTYIDGLDDTTTPDDIMAFLQSRIPDLDTQIALIIEAEKVEIADKTNQLLQLAQNQSPDTSQDNMNAN